MTDLDGNFSLNLTASKQLTISYVGMKTKVVNAAGKSSLNIVLEDDATSLNDVVVIGYGSVRKKDLTGSVATVNSEALQAVPVASASEALTGKMAGVQVTTTEGSPDAEVKIRVRGGGSPDRDGKEGAGGRSDKGNTAPSGRVQQRRLKVGGQIGRASCRERV